MNLDTRARRICSSPTSPSRPDQSLLRRAIQRAPIRPSIHQPPCLAAPQSLPIIYDTLVGRMRRTSPRLAHLRLPQPRGQTNRHTSRTTPASPLPPELRHQSLLRQRQVILRSTNPRSCPHQTSRLTTLPSHRQHSQDLQNAWTHGHAFAVLTLPLQLRHQALLRQRQIALGAQTLTHLTLNTHLAHPHPPASAPQPGAPAPSGAPPAAPGTRRGSDPRVRGPAAAPPPAQQQPSQPTAPTRAAAAGPTAAWEGAWSRSAEPCWRQCQAGSLPRRYSPTYAKVTQVSSVASNECSIIVYQQEARGGVSSGACRGREKASAGGGQAYLSLYSCAARETSSGGGGPRASMSAHSSFGLKGTVGGLDREAALSVTTS